MQTVIKSLTHAKECVLSQIKVYITSHVSQCRYPFYIRLYRDNTQNVTCVKTTFDHSPLISNLMSCKTRASSSNSAHIAIFRRQKVVKARLRLRGIHGGQIATKKFRVILSELFGGIGPTSFAGGGEKERREVVRVIVIFERRRRGR